MNEMYLCINRNARPNNNPLIKLQTPGNRLVKFGLISLLFGISSQVLGVWESIFVAKKSKIFSLEKVPQNLRKEKKVEHLFSRQKFCFINLTFQFLLFDAINGFVIDP